LAVSFPKSSADMVKARQLLRAVGGDALLIAKIERAEAVEPKALTDIIRLRGHHSGSRGSRGRSGAASVPRAAKTYDSSRARTEQAHITATQMMESMISSPVPRAPKC